MKKKKEPNWDLILAKESKGKKNRLKNIFPDRNIEINSEDVEEIEHLPNKARPETLDAKPKPPSEIIEWEDTLIGNEIPEFEAIPQARKCIDCGEKLDSSRYFHCKKCVKDLPEDCGEFIYHT